MEMKKQIEINAEEDELAEMITKRWQELKRLRDVEIIIRRYGILIGIPKEETRNNVVEAICKTWIRIFQNLWKHNSLFQEAQKTQTVIQSGLSSSLQHFSSNTIKQQMRFT